MTDVDTTRELEIFKFGDLGKGEVEIIEVSVHGEEADGGHVSKTFLYKDVQKALKSYRDQALDDLLEAMAKKRPILENVSDSINDYSLGHNAAITKVTDIVHQLKKRRSNGIHR